MEYVLAITERRRLLMPMPFALAKLQAMFLQFLPKPLLTPDQVELLKTDNVVSAEAEREGRTLRGPRHRADGDGDRSCRPISGASARPASSGPAAWPAGAALLTSDCRGQAEMRILMAAAVVVLRQRTRPLPRTG